MPPAPISPSILDRVLFWSTALLGVAPALAFAGRPLWVISLIAIAVGVLLAISGVIRLKRPGNGLAWSGKLLAGAGFLWAAVIVYALCQALLTSPSTGVWSDAARLTGEATPGRSSYNPGATLNGALRFMAYGGLCWLAYWTCRGRSQGWAVLWAITAATALAAIYGILGKVLGWESVLWRDKFYYAGFATGPFENRNTFATFLAIGLAANISLFARAVRRARLGDFVGVERTRQIMEFTSRQGILLALPGLAMLAAGLMTGSRAGFAALAFAGVLTAVVIAIRAPEGRTLWSSLGVLALAAGVIGGLWLLGGGETAKRAGDLAASAEYRLQLYGDAMGAIEAAPPGGYGLGAFPEAIHRFKSSALVNDWRRAHNSYLELVLEIGWPAAFAAFLAVALSIAAGARGLWTRSRSAPIAASALSASLAAAAHSLVDFPLQEPGVALMLALLLGAAAAQADGRNSMS